MDNVIVWVDIPVSDLKRAAEFYSKVLEMPVNIVPGMDGIALPGTSPQPGQPVPDVSTVAFDLYVGGTPGAAGPTVYLSSKGDFAGILARVRAAGGEVLQEPQDMGPMVGTIAFITDTDGNRIGIHEPPAGM